MNLERAAILVAAMIVFSASGTGAVAQEQHVDLDVRLGRIENGLLPQARVEGRTYQPQSLGEMMQLRNVPGLSVAVIDNGQLAWARGYGLADIASGRPVTPETRFQAASISKAVAAVGALDMVEDGLLDLDEPVNARLRSWTIPDGTAPGGAVTLRHLLGHTAGLTVHGFPGYAPGEPLPFLTEILDGAPPANTGAVVVEAVPGVVWKYSGGGYTVLQLLMEETAGPFPALLNDRVLEPFGMLHSTFEQSDPVPDFASRATAYKHDQTPVLGGAHLYPEMAAAGLWTTPTDLARWAVGLMDAWSGRSVAVLNQETARMMMTPGLGGWGLGLAVKGEGDRLEFTHGGANEGFRALVLGFPERGQGIVIMTNSDAGMSVGVPLLQAVAAEYGWPGYGPVMITPVAVTPQQLADVSGVYAEAGGQVEVRPSATGDSLEVLVSNGMRLELVPVGDDVYADIDAGGRSRFERDADGKVVAFNPGFARFARVTLAP